MLIDKHEIANLKCYYETADRPTQEYSGYQNLFKKFENLGLIKDFKYTEKLYRNIPSIMFTFNKTIKGKWVLFRNSK